MNHESARSDSGWPDTLDTRPKASRSRRAGGDRRRRRQRSDWFLEFFAATIRNKNTRMAYYRAATDFFAWLDGAGIVALVDIEPLHVATYIEALQDS